MHVLTATKIRCPSCLHIYTTRGAVVRELHTIDGKSVEVLEACPNCNMIAPHHVPVDCFLTLEAPHIETLRDVKRLGSIAASALDTLIVSPLVSAGLLNATPDVATHLPVDYTLTRDGDNLLDSVQQS